MRETQRLTEQSRIGFLAIGQKTAERTLDGGFSGNFLGVRAYSVREPTAPMTRFHALYERYSRDVYRFALYLSGDPALADDVTSETFIRVWSSPEPVRLGTVKAYLLTIARNLWLMERRRCLRRQHLDETIPDSSQSTLRQVEVKDELGRVLRALQEFPEVDRAALLMRADEGLPYEEIAVALGLPVTTVKVKVHRARFRLAQIRNQGVSA
jgi:RNA polymerase sigma-70 factor, ECF subfamily